MYLQTERTDRPSPTDVERIAALRDPVLRNLQITQCYHELSLVVAARTAPAANWCTFATWASKQAGQTIRKEDMRRTLERFLTSESRTEPTTDNVVALAQALDSPREPNEIRQQAWAVLNPLGAMERASDSVARGNLKVFAEIGREFARFAATCLDDPSFNADHLAHFCASLRPGEPPEGQRLLRQAFARYYQALFERDPKVRAEAMLLANLEIGLHEQTRLQPEITAALEAGWVKPRLFTLRLLQALFPGRGWFLYLTLLVRHVFRRPTLFDLAMNQLRVDIRQQLRSLVTEHMMVLTLPHGVCLRLGEDLHAEFPALIKQVANPDLLVLLKEIDPTPDSLSETGAVDWSNLAERLHFIADLFRCYGETADLFEPPFTLDQTTALKAGQLPLGSL
ncbi:MAG: hypothetical protein HZB51_06270 [Chloroflexi bacterium]|nr:hypothetical protein [Chloroflexota bacterium]